MASATDVVRYLINHGAKARAEIVDHREGEAGEALIDIAKQRGADLIVRAVMAMPAFAIVAIRFPVDVRCNDPLLPKLEE